MLRNHSIVIAVILCMAVSTSVFAQDAAPAAEPTPTAASTPPTEALKAPAASGPQGQFAFPQGTEGVKARDIYRACKNYFESTFNTRENTARKSICNGYFFGVGGTLLALSLSKVQTGICLPDTISTEQIIHDFIDWGIADTNNLDYLASQGTLTALAQKYPCF